MSVNSVLAHAANAWLHCQPAPEGVTVSEFRIPDAVGAAQRTGMGHYLGVGAELSYEGETRIAAVWLCGASTVDGFMFDDQHEPACASCHFTRATPRGPVVYRLFDADDELLYVGFTANAAQRMRGHSSEKQWWPDVARASFERFDTEVSALKAEAKAIRETPGLHNRASRIVPSIASPLLGIVIDTTEAAS